MGIFNFLKKTSDQELDRLEEIINIKGKLSKEKINISQVLWEGEFYNQDSTHLSLLKKLKEVDDKIMELISQENLIVENTRSDDIKNAYEILNNKCPEDNLPVPSEMWEIFQNKGK